MAVETLNGNMQPDGIGLYGAALAFLGAGSTAIRVPVAEETLVDSAPTSETFEAAAKIVSAELDPPADIHGSTAYRKHLAGVLTRRGLAEAVATTQQIGASA